MNLIEIGDCRETMRRWAAEGVRAQMCVTSPPYFGLRDYGHPGQLGLEQTPEQYVAAMVEVFRCVRDVLADDGTLWLNIGDSYNAAGRTGHGTRVGFKQGTNRASAEGADNCRPSVDGLKPKDLIGIPWMLAFALRADGWYLRQDIIWHKPNPMPESVRDRCTKAHEYVFLLSKSERYFFDSEAIKEPSTGRPKFDGNKGRAVTDPSRNDHGRFNPEISETRNRRSVWTVATKPYKGAHFATFPPALIEPCILAGSRLGDIVLDPFMGSGTTAQVALQHERNYLGCELNTEYKPLQDERISKAIENKSPQLQLLPA
jgi:DNA modification methylase